MGNLRLRQRFLEPIERWRLKLLFLISVLALMVPSCLVATTSGDNATSLSYSIEKASKAAAGAERVLVGYRPSAGPDAPYDLIFFPDRKVTREDLVGQGLSEAKAARVFEELGYVDIGQAPLLVVIQESVRLNFTSHWKRFARTEELTVIQGLGTTQLVFEASAEGLVLMGARER